MKDMAVATPVVNTVFRCTYALLNYGIKMHNALLIHHQLTERRQIELD